MSGRVTDAQDGQWPLGYFLTFATYGRRLHGDQRGSVDREHHQPGTPMLDPSTLHEQLVADRMRTAPVLLAPAARRVVEDTVREVCQFRRWELVAVDARSNHVHLVVKATEEPEAVLTTLKAWCTRRLREAQLATGADTPIWARHGSTKYLWDDDAVRRTAEYVTEYQAGERFEEDSSGAFRV